MSLEDCLNFNLCHLSAGYSHSLNWLTVNVHEAIFCRLTRFDAQLLDKYMESKFDGASRAAHIESYLT